MRVPRAESRDKTIRSARTSYHARDTFYYPANLISHRAHKVKRFNKVPFVFAKIAMQSRLSRTRFVPANEQTTYCASILADFNALDSICQQPPSALRSSRNDASRPPEKNENRVPYYIQPTQIRLTRNLNSDSRRYTPGLYEYSPSRPDAWSTALRMSDWG